MRQLSLAALFWFALTAACLIASPLWGSHGSAGQKHLNVSPPRGEITRAYPSETGRSRALERTVPESARQAVTENLPFRIEFSELGPQTLYVAYSDRQPLGLAQVRIEEGRWGLLEVVWIFDLDLTLRDVVMRRCRDRRRAAIESPDFTDQLRGKTAQEMLQYLDDKNNCRTVNHERLRIEPRASALAATVLRSGITTASLIETVWSRDLAELRVLERAWKAFEGTHVVRPITDGFDSRVLAALKERANVQPEPSQTHRSAFLAAQAFDDEGHQLGTVIHAKVGLDDDAALSTLWTVKREIVLQDITPSSGSWPDEATQETARALRGWRLADFGTPKSAYDIVAVEVLTLARIHAHVR